MLPQQYCLRWKYHHSNLQTMFSQLLDRGCFCDVTLACEGQLIRAHRVVLCACSTFFDSVLTNYASERDPIIIMRDVTFADIKCLIEFMYKGEINVEHANLASLLKTADDLKIKGLAEVTWRDDDDQPPPPPTPQTEFLSPTLQRASTNVYEYADYAAGNVGGGHDNQQYHQSQKTRTRTPEELESNRHKTTYSPKQHCVSQTPPRIPSLPVVPTSTGSVVTAASSQIDAYMGQKRKRGRPPLDDSYDVFNVKKLQHGEINTNNTPVTLADNPQYNENMRELSLETGDSSPRRTAVAAYQQHIYKLRARPKSLHSTNAIESEWINTNLETSENQPKLHDLEEDERLETERQDWKITNNVEEDPRNRKHEYRTHEKTPEQQKIKITKRKSLKGDNNSSLEMKNDVLKTDEKSENTTDYAEKVEGGKVKHMKDADVIKEEHVSDGENTSTMKKPNSSPSSNVSSSSPSSDTAIHTGTKKSNHSMSAAVQLAHTYSTYCPEGYMINEHGMLMTHDFAHPPIPDIPTSSAAAANGHSTEEYADIKMEEFNESELRLTSEEMSQWQDVIKMDDYLAKGRRPQFWEEPFTRRVLDAIKGKRLEMKKAARILGVSYGTLYGRYRETYGCLKHPYNSTSMRSSQSSALSVPSRFDIVWPSAKPGQLDIGKLRPKDLSELWTRPQI